METSMNFKKGAEKREELELPTLHFVVMDQWIDVIGDKALFAWLKMYTWCDRDRSKDDKPVDLNLWEQSKIPDSLTKIAKRLGVGNGTFYNKMLKPLWNVGLIDIEEWTEDPRSGQKAMNVIVYKYPQNNKALSFTKIEEIRNYDTDYSSTARSFAKKSGGRPKKEEQEVPNSEKQGASQIEGGGLLVQKGGASQIEGGGFSNRTGGASQIEDSNILTPSFNALNTSYHNLNSYPNIPNSSSSSNAVKTFKEEEEEKNYIINTQNMAYMILTDFLIEAGIDQVTVNKTIAELSQFNIDLFIMEDVEKQFEHMMFKKQSGERIFDFPKYFAKGLKDLTVQSNANRHYQAQKLQEYEAAKQNTKPVKFYNWLTDRD